MSHPRAGAGTGYALNDQNPRIERALYAKGNAYNPAEDSMTGHGDHELSVWMQGLRDEKE